MVFWFFGIFVFFNIQNVLSLDVNWTPSDPDGPLPLSSKYRNDLSKLCQLIENNKPLPKKIKNEKETIAKLCQKLKDSNESLLEDSYSTSPHLIYLLIGAGVLYLLFSNKDKLLKIFSNPSTLSPKNALASSGDPLLARQARLKKFDRID
jgi:hypothetical protein